jgi:putative membrane protein
LSTSKIHWSYIVFTLSVFAIGFISQGAIDATMYFLGYTTFNEGFLVLEILAGFLLAIFSGLLNSALRNLSQKSDAPVKEGQQGGTETSH